MSEPTAASDHEQHTTTIEITGNGQINAAFENTEGPEGAPTPQTPPPPPQIQRPNTPPPQAPRPNTPPPQIPTAHPDTTHMNGETPHMNGETKTNGVELRTPGSEDNKDVTEAVNLELVNMQPYSNSIPIKKESTELDIGDPYDEYFVPVNQHKKYMRGEKLYVTQDKRRSLGGSKKKCCWGVLTVIVLGGIVAILLGVILSSQETPAEESRNFNGMKASIGGGIIATPSPSSTPQPARPTTDMSEMYLNNLLQGELTIDNLEFTPGLADHNSSEFRNMAASLEAELKSALFDHQTLHYGSADITVKVLEFRPGSVVVVYRVGWEFKDGIKNPPDPIDKDGLKVRLQEHLRSNDGFLYNYRLTLHNLKSERVINVCKIDNGGCNQNCIFDRNNLQMMCACEKSYILSNDGKTCIISEHIKPDPSPSEDDSMITSSKHENDTTLEVQQTSSDPFEEHIHSPVTEVPIVSEPSPEPELPPETELPPQHEHTVTQQPTEPSSVKETSPEPLPENNTSMSIVDYQSVQDSNPMSSSESNMVDQPMTEVNSSSETAFVGHEQYGKEQTTEAISHIKTTDISIGSSSSEPVLEFQSSTNSYPANISELPLEPRTPIPMYSYKDFNTESGFDLGFETTPVPPVQIYSEETVGPYHQSNESSEVPGTHEYPNEFSSSSAVPPTSSERLAKYNQFPPVTSELEDSSHIYGGDNEFTLETTTIPEELVKEQLSVLPDYKTEQPSENSNFLYSSSQIPMRFTEVHEEISTEKISSDNTEIKSGDSFVNGHSTENYIPSSSTAQSHSSTGFKEEEISTDIEVTTNKSFGVWEKVEDHSMNLHGDSGPNNISSEVDEINGIINVTTVMPPIQIEEVNQNVMIASYDSKSLHNISEPTTVSLEMKTELPPTAYTTRDSQNMSYFGPSSTVYYTETDTIPIEHTYNKNIETVTMPTEHTVSKKEETETVPTENSYNGFNQNPDHSSITMTLLTPSSSMDLITMTTPSPSSSSIDSVTTTTPSPPFSMEPFDEISSNTNQSSSTAGIMGEMDRTVAEMVGETFVSPDILKRITNDTNQETETNGPITESASSSMQPDNTVMEQKMPLSDYIDNDTMTPTFLVGGENMPPIALTPNPDLSGPYSVDSTIQPITEEDETELIRPTETITTDDSANAEVDHSNHWYDSKNALNSLDDDYNEEDKYANYKSVKGKLEHVTKGYKNIKIEENVRVPQDNDAVEQTHNQQIEEVPVVKSESDSSSNLSATETYESLTISPQTEKISSKIKEEEKLLIQEVYTEGTGGILRPNVESEHSTEKQSEINDLNTMRPSEESKTLLNTNEPMVTISSMASVEQKSEPNGMNFTLSSTIDDKSNINPLLDSISSTDATPMIAGSSQSSEGSSFTENIPMSTVLYDEMNSSNSMAIKCGADKFACHDGSKCLLKSQQCDGFDDCDDESDEEDCENINCGENFECNDGTCLSKHLVCNGFQNCPDGDDEEDCDSDETNKMRHNEQMLEQHLFTDTTDADTPERKTELVSTDFAELLPSSNPTEAPIISMKPFNNSSLVPTSMATIEDVSNNTYEAPFSSISPALNDTLESTSKAAIEEAAIGDQETYVSSMETVSSSTSPARSMAEMGEVASSTQEASASSVEPVINSTFTSMPTSMVEEVSSNTMATMEEVPSSSHEADIISAEPVNGNTLASTAKAAMKEISNTTDEILPDNTTEITLSSTLENSSKNSLEGTVSSSPEPELNRSLENTTILPSGIILEGPSSGHSEATTNNIAISDMGTMEHAITTMETVSKLTEPISSFTDIVPGSVEPVSSSTEFSSSSAESISNTNMPLPL